MLRIFKLKQIYMGKYQTLSQTHVYQTAGWQMSIGELYPGYATVVRKSRAARAFPVEKSLTLDPSLLKDVEWQIGNLHMTVNMKEIVM